jgi:hypothetical protein
VEILRIMGRPSEVVVKDRMFENWLVADIEALKALRGRFRISRSVERSIDPNKADQVDALRILKSCVVRDSYSKVRDSQQILARAAVASMGRNSRSFRRFLHCVGDPTYAAQSKRPKRDR